MRRSLPNALSASRIPLAVGILALVRTDSLAGYSVVISLWIIALLTDLLDGRLARKLGVPTELGYVLDTLGDRALHLALVLFFLVRHQFHPLLVWLIVFRDIAIYSVRLLSRGWLGKSLEARWLSKANAGALRVWLTLYLIRDGLALGYQRDILAGRLFEASQMSMLLLTLVLSYYSLFRSVRWINAEITR